jgi:hypothetical protein
MKRKLHSLIPQLARQDVSEPLDIPLAVRHNEMHNKKRHPVFKNI